MVEWESLSSSLETLDLSGNEFTNTIDPLAVLTELRELKVASNVLTGAISPKWAHCIHMSTFDCSNNELSGSIPTLHLTRMPRLVLVYLHGNKVSRGSYPFV